MFVTFFFIDFQLLKADDPCHLTVKAPGIASLNKSQNYMIDVQQD